MRRWLTNAALVAIIVSVAASTQPDSGKCPLKPVTLSLSGGDASGTTILLSNGSRLGGGAMVWDQPMRLRGANGKICAVDADVSIITSPIYDAGGRVLYVTTYSGSNSKLYVVSAHDCRVLWQSRNFTRGPFLSHQTISFSDAPAVQIAPNCLPRP